MESEVSRLERELKQAYYNEEKAAIRDTEGPSQPHPVDTCNEACYAPATNYPYPTQPQQKGIYGCDTRAGGRPATRAESTIHRLDEVVYRATVDSEKAARVRDILTRHPEFFELMEVLNSGLV